MADVITVLRYGEDHKRNLAEGHQSHKTRQWGARDEPCRINLDGPEVDLSYVPHIAKCRGTADMLYNLITVMLSKNYGSKFALAR